MHALKADLDCVQGQGSGPPCLACHERSRPIAAILSSFLPDPKLKWESNLVFMAQESVSIVEQDQDGDRAMSVVDGFVLEENRTSHSVRSHDLHHNHACFPRVWC